MSSMPWTDEEKDFMKKNYLTMHKKTIAERLGKTLDSVKNMGRYMNLVTRKPQRSYSQTINVICWHCKHATNKYGACSWSRDFEPVKGWVATKKVLYKGKAYETIGYAV